VSDAADVWAERLLFASTMAGLVLGAWLALGLVGASPYSGYLDHSVAVESATLPYEVRLAVFVAGWTVMSVAMMLPSSLPLVTVFRTITRRRAQALQLLVEMFVMDLLVLTLRPVIFPDPRV